MAYEIYTLGVPRAWPHRLLHIPSMTSREWKPGNVYGQDTEPSYSILSYTWGRYEVPDGPRLHIKGIDWQVPSINVNHFTVASLSRLLEQVMLQDEYIWIDIACIDQKREKDKMEEIGRQASIFKGARQAYIWLNKYEPETLSQHMQNLMRCGYNFAQGGVDTLQSAEEMVGSISHIIQDPWFSSLWTLQESVLQRHAILLDKRGEPITTHGPWMGESAFCELMDISGACAIARNLTDQAMQAESGADHDGSLSVQSRWIRSLRTIIDESGVDFTLCPNPNIQYAAARFRQTLHPEDRIYAIMQVYGYRLGNSATSIRRIRHFALEDLELQFLTTLTSQSVVLSQAFQHLRVPESGQSWCITNNIRVPERLHKIAVHDQFLSSACTISVRKKSEAYFKGTACTLRELLDFWKSRSQKKLTWLDKASEAPSGLKERDAYFKNGLCMDRFFKRAKQGMFMDCSDSMSFEWPPDTAVVDDRGEPITECRVPELTQAANTQQVIGEAIITRHSDMTPSVLYLGRTKHIESMEVALIIVREGSARSGIRMEKKGIWRRVGICFWHVEGGSLDHLAKSLQPLKGRFG